MRGTLITIDPVGTKTVKEIEGEPTLDILKAGIGGGNIEIVPGFISYIHNGKRHPCVAFCDEEGKIKGQPFNECATKCWQDSLVANGHPGLFNVRGEFIDHCVGTIAIIWGDSAFMRAL